jgi:hypothetical protein
VLPAKNNIALTGWGEYITIAGLCQDSGAVQGMPISWEIPLFSARNFFLAGASQAPRAMNPSHFDHNAGR